MSQFDVHRNIGQQRENMPYVVIVQSAAFDSWRRRIVVPLVRGATATSSFRAARFNPRFTIEGIEVILHPIEIASVAMHQLGIKVGDLKEHGSTITDALDEVFSRTWG